MTLTAYLIHRNSPESKDGDEEMHAALERIEARLDRAVGGANGQEPAVSTYRGSGPPTGARPL